MAVTRHALAVPGWFWIDQAWAKRREAFLRAEEDAAISVARDEAPTPTELRALLDQLLDERVRSRARA